MSYIVFPARSIDRSMSHSVRVAFDDFERERETERVRERERKRKSERDRKRE